jgi:hypothetical protein
MLCLHDARELLVVERCIIMIVIRYYSRGCAPRRTAAVR